MDENNHCYTLPRGFFQEIKIAHGDRTARALKDWTNNLAKLAALKNRRIFLLKCRSNKVIPKHINNNIKSVLSLTVDNHPFKMSADKLVTRFQFSILKLEIKITLWKLEQMDKRTKEIKEEVKRNIPQQLFDVCEQVNRRRYKNIFNKIKNSNIKKLDALVKKKLNVHTLNNNDKHIYNYTDVVLPPEVEMILNLEPKFGIEIKDKLSTVPIIIKDLEYGIEAVKLEDNNIIESEIIKNNLRSRAINIISNFYKKSINNKHEVIMKNLNITKKFLKTRSDIIVARSDQGNTTVVMFKEEYDREMRKLINDVSTYKCIPKDPTQKWQKTANNLVNELFSLGLIEEWQVRQLKANYTVAPRIYGLRKTHKQTCNLRPVVNCINSPSYNLARYLHEILTPVAETFQFNVKNSFDFVAFSKTVKLPESYVLVSLDVVSLFTNVRRDLVLKVIEETWENIKHLVKIPKKILIDIIVFCYDASYFIYQGEFYAQIEGSSMGNPASPVIANIVMNYVIDQILILLPFQIKFLKLYVDDTILAIPESEVENILEVFNRFDHNIQFTMELEKDNSISFLDVLVIRSNGELLTDWFVKPISSGRLLNFNSNHPHSQKIGMVNGILNRMTRLSNIEFYDKNFKRIKKMLLDNNYNSSFIDLIINKFKRKLENNTELAGNRNNIIKYCRFPFLADISYKLNRIFLGTNVRLVFYNILSVNSIYSKLKDPIIKKQQSGVIYKIPCSCKLCYIGQTKQYLDSRIKQHINDCKNINFLKENKTALSSHHFEELHNFDFEKIEILDIEANWLKRNISEMIYIKTNDTVNMRTDTKNLSILYNEILSVYKSNRKK